MDEKLLFFCNFFKNPKEIGAVVPSSRFLIKEMLKSVDFEKAKYIAEYGPGTGRITTEILNRARGDAKVLCFEVNKKFCKHLRSNIKDERLVVINDSAEVINKHIKKLGIDRLDYVICSLPFYTLGKYVKDNIINETKKALGSRSNFISYRYLPIIDRNMNKYFPRISTKLVMLNIPPTWVDICGA